MKLLHENVYLSFDYKCPKFYDYKVVEKNPVLRSIAASIKCTKCESYYWSVYGKYKEIPHLDYHKSPIYYCVCANCRNHALKLRYEYSKMGTGWIGGTWGVQHTNYGWIPIVDYISIDLLHTKLILKNEINRQK